jgi:hypothetical protein
MPNEQRPLKVFLCHASADKPKARELYRYLRRRGIKPWFDEVDLVGGQDWQVEIPKALSTSDAIIICLTKNSVDKEGYIQKEIKFALDKALGMPEGRIFLIPVRFEECDVPFSLSRYQWVDLFDEAGYARMMRALKFRAAQLERTAVEMSKRDVEEERLSSEKAVQEAREKPPEKKIEQKENPLSPVPVEIAGQNRPTSFGGLSLPSEHKAFEPIDVTSTGIIKVGEAGEKEHASDETKQPVEKSITAGAKSRSRDLRWPRTVPVIAALVGLTIAALLVFPLIEKWFSTVPIPTILATASTIHPGSLLQTVEPSVAPDQNTLLAANTPITGTAGTTLVIDETSAPQLTLTPISAVEGMLVYKTTGKNGVPDIYIVDLVTGRQVQKTSNQGFSFTNEKISDDKKLLALNFRYGAYDDYKLGVINLDTDERVEITNDLKIAESGQFDWLPNEKLLFANANTNQIEVYEALEGKREVLGPGSRYFLSPDRETIIMVDRELKSFTVGKIGSASNDLTLIDYSVDPARGSGSEIIWAPDGEKFVILHHSSEKWGLSLWSKEGIRDNSFSVENADAIDFSWGKSGKEYAYVVGYLENKDLAYTLYVNSKNMEIEQLSKYPIEIQMLPDGNVIYGYYNPGSYLVDVDNMSTTEIPNGSFSLSSVNTDTVILYSYPHHFILADKNGFHEFEFTLSNSWNWNWLLVANKLWLLSGNEGYVPDANERKTLSIPASATVLAWAPVDQYPSFLLMPTVSPPSTEPILICSVSNPDSEPKLSSRRCSCGEFVCNCRDDSWGWISDRYWQRDRSGIEEYFRKLGGTCQQ